MGKPAWVGRRAALLGWLVVAACGSGDGAADVAADAGADAATDSGDSSGDASVSGSVCGQASGPSVDLVPFARLSASATRAPLIPPWPREDTDSIATVRDGDPSTGWKVPVGEPVTVTIDVEPLLGGPVNVNLVTALFTQPGPDRLELRVRRACGGEQTSPTWRMEGFGTMLLTGACGGCFDLTVQASSPTTLTTLRVMGRAAGSRPVDTEAVPEPEPEQASVTDRGAGVVEGFYGVPWSFAERRRMLHTLAHLGLGTFIYAPKSDPLHRRAWRTPYPESFTDALGELAALGEDLGVDVVFGISPFVDFAAGSATDRAALAQKLEALTRAGVRHFAILADDIEVDADLFVDAELGQFHVAETLHALAAVRAVTPDATMRFVPTVYSDQRRMDLADGDGYLAALSGLPADVPWLWTGPGTGNTTLAPADLTSATALVGRPPMIWDNLWANDGGDGFFGRILLGSYAGRDPGLRAATAGIVQNPLKQGGLARLAVATFGLALSGADPETLREKAAAVEAIRSAGDPVADAQIAATVMRAFDAVHDEVPGDHSFESALTDLETAMSQSDAAALGDALNRLLPLIAELATLESSAYHSGLAPDLVDELDFPLDKVRAEAERALYALLLLAGAAPPSLGATLQAALADAEERSINNRFVFSPGATDAIAARATAAAGPAGLSAIVTLKTPDPDCEVGKPYKYEPDLLIGTRLTAGGPPGIHTSGQRTEFTPTHAGVYDLLVIAWVPESGAIAAARTSLICRPSR